MANDHLSDFKLPKIVIACSCGRKGVYDRDRAIERLGDILIREFIESVVRACPDWRRDPDKTRCRGGCDDLIYMFSNLPELQKDKRKA